MYLIWEVKQQQLVEMLRALMVKQLHQEATDRVYQIKKVLMAETLEDYYLDLLQI